MLLLSLHNIMIYMKKVIFYCKNCNKTFSDNIGTYSICPICNEKTICTNIPVETWRERSEEEKDRMKETFKFMNLYKKKSKVPYIIGVLILLIIVLIPFLSEATNNEEVKFEEPVAVVDRYYYNTLDNEEKQFYIMFYNSSLKYEGSFEFSNYFDKTKFDNAYYAFINDYPLYYWWGYGVETNTINGISIVKANDFNKEEVENNCNTLLSTSNYILGQCMTNSDYDTIKNIHDYLVNNISYKKDNKNSHNIVGSLIENESVCDGYSLAFKYLAENAGYKCIMILGDAYNDKGSEAHAWNIISINGHWYGVDVTWDDPTYDDGSEGDPVYEYFLTTDEIINIDHFANSSNYPICDDISLYFLNMPGMFIKTKDQYEITNFLVYWLKQGEQDFYIKFSNYNDALQIGEWLVADKEFSNIYRRYYDAYSGFNYGYYLTGASSCLYVYYRY